MKIIQKFWPVLFIFIVWFIFASPYFLKGLVPYSSTYQVNHFTPWSSYAKFWGPVKNGAMPDVTSQIYPWKKFTIEMLKQGQIPLWNPYSFSGTPHLANYQSAVLSPFNFLFFAFSFVDAWSLLVLLQPLLAGVFMYLFVRSLKVSKTGSLISSFSFMFCGFITVWMGYATLGYAILFLPLALFAIENFYLSNKKRYLLLFSFAIPLSFFSGHFQISIYFFLFVCGYIFYKFITTKNKKIFLILLFSFGCGLLLSFPQILPSIGLYLESLRSSLFQKGEVIPWSYLPTLIAPDFLGNPVTRNDWFGHYAEWNGYAGLIPLILAVYGLFHLKRKPIVVFLFLTALFSLLMAFDSPLLNLIFLLHIPVLATSSASRVIVLFSFSIACLAGLGFDELLKDSFEKNRKVFFYTSGIFLAAFGLLWLFVMLKIGMPLDKIQIAKSNLKLPTLLFILFILLAFVSFTIKEKNKKQLVVCLLIFVSAFDILRFSIKWQAFDPKNLVFANVPITDFFQKIAGYDRSFGDFGGEDTVYYHLPSVEGYDAVYIERYGAFIASLNDGVVRESGRSVVRFPKNGLYTKQALNLLDIRYIIHKVSDDHASWALPFWTYPKEQ